MALANIAVLLAHQGLRVLAVDWDLEAAGLDLYFRDYRIKNHQDVGLLDLFNDAKSMFNSGQKPDWRNYLSEVNFGYEIALSLITSGHKEERHNKSYNKRVLEFDWDEFFQEYDGGDFIESLREDWLDNYDIILVDSRTGITDSGGICTIQVPDILILIFTANEQSLNGAKEIALKAQAARQKLAYDRLGLLVFPVPSRYDGRTEYGEGRRWMQRFARELKPFYAWLPKTLEPLEILEKIKLPYIPYFSFGEKLAVIGEETYDPESLGYGYNVLAKLIGNEFSEREVNNLIRSDITLIQDEEIAKKKTRYEFFLRFFDKEFVGAVVGAILLFFITAAQIGSTFKGIYTSDILNNSFLVILGYFFGNISSKSNLGKSDGKPVTLLSFFAGQYLGNFISIIILLIFAIVIAVSSFTGRPMSDILHNGFLVILGYFFGQSTNTVDKQ